MHGVYTAKEQLPSTLYLLFPNCVYWFLVMLRWNILITLYLLSYCGYCMVHIFGRGKLWQISQQKLFASKTFENSCLFAFFIYVGHKTLLEFG